MDIPLAGSPAADPTTSHLTPERKAAYDTVLAEHQVVLFMKGTPQEPRCGFSARAAAVMDATGVDYHAVDVFADDDPMGNMLAVKQWADFPTLPQLWIRGELIGGSDIALELHESGELQRLLAGEN